jgi:16S rRNA (guanine527-N7)-methyltransferase
LARPDLEITLLDSARKKTEFLQKTVQELGLSGIKVLHGRAEELGRQESHREKYLLVVSRALARLDILLELCLPFVAAGGLFAAYKGPGFAAELEGAGYALAELGARPEKTWEYTLPEEMGERALLLFRKTGPTPAGYPRRSGLPGKKPLRP